MSTFAPERASTLFPRISGRCSDFVTGIKKQLEIDDDNSTKVIHLIGTVKLHGAHADVVVSSNDDIRFQSRNISNLTAKNDVFGFAAAMLPLKATLLTLRNRIYARFNELCPESEIQLEHPLIIAAEWIGPGIQEKVAISKLASPMFVIVSININNSWVDDELYGDIHDEANGIYHISKGGFYHREFDLETPEESFSELQVLADAVELECPFAHALGITGLGEGIVWKPTSPRSLAGNASFWLKSKGPSFRTRPLPKRKAESNLEYVREFAGSVLNEMRLEQAWQYMEEMKIPKTKAGVVPYMGWLVEDVKTEEKTVIEEENIDWRALKREIEKIGKEWYMRRLA